MLKEMTKLNPLSNNRTPLERGLPCYKSELALMLKTDF